MIQKNLLMNEKTLFGHPRSLFLLFFAEMWERFSFYGMRALLVLYLIDKTQGGQGWNRADASSLYGNYLSAIYLTSIAGGYLADRYLGYRKAVLIGGAIIVLGHLSLAFDSLTFFYLGICLLVAGTGLLKPNISSMVGQLYPDGSKLKDSAYTIFYMGINVGGFFGPIVCGELAKVYGWHYGFGIAAFGMMLGLLVFYLKQDMLGTIGLQPSQSDTFKIDKNAAKIPLTAIERDRLMVIGILSFFSIVFWMSFEQAGASINIFAQDYTDKHIFGYEVSAASIQSVNSFWIIVLAIPMSWIWVKLDAVKRNPSSPYKFAWGLFFLGTAFVLMAVATQDIPQGAMTASKSLWLLIAFYALQTVGELCISPVGLATVNKLSPPQLLGFMYGIWFSATAVGNKLAGFLSSLIDDLQKAHSMSYFFGVFVVATFVMSAIAFIFGKKLTAMMHGVK